MGATESTSRSNGTEEEEEEQRRRGNNSTSIGGATAIAATAGVAVAAAWGLSRMLSNSNNTEDTQETTQHPHRIIYEGSSQRSTWSPPPPPRRFKMNTDGGCHPRSGRPDEYVGTTRVERGPSGYGGIIRDHNNEWVGGFMGFMGESNSLTSEFYGILKGLELLDKLNINGSIILETDCQPAYQFIKEQKQPEYLGKSRIIRDNWPRILKCRRLADENDIEIKLISRDENKYADKLANMAIEGQVEYVEIEELPDELKVIAMARRTTYI